RMIAGNLFTGLQEINRICWDEHFEELSLVEQTLRQDPARIYPKMDFESRDLMRRELELSAREWRLPEKEVAKKSLALA
ncbi:MAG TPA: hypothetical protein DD734_07425, partial [Firmicutes bacterium]|nr:hypothetical protein [Bacillota bacterium]